MLIPIIQVRDNSNGTVHVVGTNSHDTLYIDEKTGGIYYHNLQNSEGSQKYDGKSEYDFVGAEGSERVRLVTFDELMASFIVCENMRKYLDDWEASKCLQKCAKTMQELSKEAKQDIDDLFADNA